MSIATTLVDAPERQTANPDDIYTASDMMLHLQRLRTHAGRDGRPVSLDRLAVLSEIPRSTLHTYLSGRSWPPPDVLDRIVIALGCDPDAARRWACAWERATDLSLAGRHRIGTNGRMSRIMDEVRDRVAPGSSSFGCLDEVVSIDRMTVGAKRSPFALQRTLTSRATSAGVDRAFHIISGRSPSAMGGMQIVAGINCRMDRCEVLGDLGVFVAEMVFDRVLDHGDLHHYGFTVIYPDDPEETMTEALRFFRRRGGAYTLEVRFDGTPPPHAVRQVYRRHPGDPEDVVATSVQRGQGSYYATVEQASSGLHGLAWDW